MVFLYVFFCERSTFVALPRSYAKSVDNTGVPVVPGQAGGGSFQKEKNYIAQKEFAYRMCAW